MTTLTSTPRAKRIATIRALDLAAKKAAKRAAAAKQTVKSAKARLKEARKAFKVEKKAAKQARKEFEAVRTSLFASAPQKPGTVNKSADPQVSPLPAKTANPKRKVSKAPKPVPKAAPKKVKAKRKLRRPVKNSAATPHPRTAAEVAKSVIERLHSPPPPLPPTPQIPGLVVVSGEKPDQTEESSKSTEVPGP